MFNVKKLLAIALSFSCAQVAFADMYDSTIGVMRQQLSCYTLDCGHWYAGANLGVSHLHDSHNPGSRNSVDENGPGGSAQLGYQFNSVFGAELGYTQYKNSRETSGRFFRKNYHAVDSCNWPPSFGL